MQSFLKIVLLLACHFQLMAQNIIVQNPENKPFEIMTNEKKVIFLKIQDIYADYEDIHLEVGMPEGFKILTKSSPKSLYKDKESQVFFAIQSETSTPCGSYVIQIDLVCNGNILNSAHVDIILLKQSSLEIIPIEKPEWLGQTSKTELSYVIRNKGNTPEQISLDTKSGQILGDKSFELGVGQSRTVKTLNLLPSNNSNYANLSFDLQAFVEGNSIPFSSTFTIPYLSSSTRKSDPYHRLPVNASISYNQYTAGYQKLGIFQFDFNGAGFIDPGLKHQVEFIARGPNQFNIPGIGIMDQYYMGYKHKDIGAAIGDRNFIISNLTEYSRFARGIELSKTLGKYEVNAFYLQPRFFNEIKNEFGLTAERKINQDIILRTVLMHKKHQVKKDVFSTNFLSLGSQIKKKNYWMISEVGFSATNGKISTAISNTGYLEIAKVKVNSNIIMAGKTFNGYYTNSLLFSNSANYHFNKKLRVSFSNNISQLNPSLDTYYYIISPFFNNNSGDISYQFNKQNRLNVYLISGKREDRQAVKSYHFKERLLRYSFETKLANWTIKNDGDFGKTQNLLLENYKDKFDNLLRNRLSVQMESEHKFSLSGFAEYLHTNKYETALQKSKFLFYGFSGTYRLNNLLDVNINYRNNFTPEELFRNQNFLDATINLKLKSQQISFNSSYGSNPALQGRISFIASIKYTLKLDVPLHKKKGLGSFLGQVNGVKTEGVVFNFNGSKVMTDKEGKFAMNDIEPGTYHLALDKSSLNFGNILDYNGPIMVHIEADSIKKIDLEVIETGRIEGSLVAKKENESSKADLENIIVAVYGDNFSKITTTNRNGKFSFSELKAGEYSLKLISKDWQKKFEMTNEDLTLKVVKGEKTNFCFSLHEKKKKILFQEGTIMLSDI